jgi:RNA polymerase sigma-70 factor (ECF subfamily)
MAARSLTALDPDAPLEQLDLLAGCLTGDSAAQNSFYERYADFVLRTVRRLGTPPEEVEDVAQEVFTIAFRRLDRFQGGQLSSWLHRICSNRVHYHHRSRRVRRAIERVFGMDSSQEETESPERSRSQLDAERGVSEILARMSPKKREVFVLFEIERLPGDVIAERVGCPVETVWSRLHYARSEFARIGRALNLLEQMRSGT